MPDPQLSAQPADSIHTKLLEVDLELAAQEAELIAQLEAVQEKRKSLKTVIELFIPANTPAAETASKPEPVTEVLPAPALEPVTPTPTAEPQAPRLESSASSPEPLGPKAAPPPLSQAPSKTQRPARRQRTTHAKTKTAREPLSWQPYIRAEFGQTSLAEVVAKILQDQPEEVFGISTMVNAIFVDEISKEVWNQARNRISNILAEGARKNKWYRDQTGQYSLSPAAVGATSLSQGDVLSGREDSSNV